MTTTTIKGTKTTTSKRSAAAAARARLDAISAGLQAEVAAVNAAIRAGAIVRIPERVGSLASGKIVESARYGYDGLWITMKNYGGSFALANDARWGEIVALAGCEADPRTGR